METLVKHFVVGIFWFASVCVHLVPFPFICCVNLPANELGIFFV